MKKTIFSVLFSFIFIFLYSCIFISPAHAALLPPCATSGEGGICCMMLLVSNVTKWILGIVGTGALLMFVYGGFLWLISAGRGDKVKKGFSIMSNTLIGILIVILAWIAINFVITSLAGSPKVILTGEGNKSWYELCSDYQACKEMGDGWQCQDYKSCASKLNSYQDCEQTKDCVRFLCPGGNENVCCK
jgi:hypothetical protein